MEPKEAKKELLEIVQTLSDALKFYANPANHNRAVPDDMGRRARLALEVIRRKSDGADSVGSSGSTDKKR